MPRIGSRTIALIGATVIAVPAQASIADCSNLYVSSIYFAMADPRPVVTFAETLDSATTTSPVYPATGLPERAYQQLYSALLTAKSTQKTVRVTTDGPNQCSLTGANYLTGIELE